MKQRHSSLILKRQSNEESTLKLDAETRFSGCTSAQRSDV